MSKYIRQESNSKSNNVFWRLGMVFFCLYLAALFPGTRLFGSLPIQKFSLYFLLIHGAITIIFVIRNGVYGTELFAWYGSFTLLSLLSLILSNGSLSNNDFYSVIICFALTVIQSFYIVNIRAFKAVCWCYILVCLINTLILIATKALVLSAGDRLGVEMGINPNVLATYLMYGVTYAIWLILVEKDKKTKIVLLFITAIITYPLMLTGGRKFFLAPIIFLGIYLFLNGDSNKNNPRMRNLIIIGAVLAVLWLAIMNVPVLYNSIGNRFEGLLNSITGKGEADMSSQQRSQLRSLAVQGWLKSPIWGHGFDTFKYWSYSNGLPLMYSHSNITELLYNGGIIQFVAYYWFFGMILWKCLKNKIMDKSLRAFCIAGIIMQVFYDYGGVSYNVYQSQLFILMIYCGMKEFKESCSLLSTNNMVKSKYIL